MAMGLSAAPGGGARLIASKIHRPATGVTYATTSTANVEIDGTNLAISFKVPASGKVKVYWEIPSWMQVAGNGWYGLRIDGVYGGDQARTFIGHHPNSGRRPNTLQLSGLTPGNTVKISVIWWVSGGAEARAYIEVGSPFCIEVWEV